METPFAIEFARSSGGRDGAPTLIPVERGGAKTQATILKLAEGTALAQSKDMLWRRETGKEESGKLYPKPTNPGPNQVVVRVHDGFQGLAHVLSTRIGGNMDPLTPESLASKAIDSARRPAGMERRDGISYLSNAIENGIVTPLTDAYRREILRQTGAGDLAMAWKACQAGGA